MALAPRVSLCMIARDESAFLPDCLASVAGAVDEIVLADTGSVDDTRAIALAAGAKVVEHPWDDDFAAARNAALAHATGDWVLILDADERLAPGAGAALRSALRHRPKWILGLLPLHDAARLDATLAEVLSGSARLGYPTALPRLVRRAPDLAWEGCVHESISGWLGRSGGTAQILDGVNLIHYGSVPEVREARNKVDRNRRLLEKLCLANPDHAPGWSYLATERWKAGDRGGALDAVERGWEALKRAHQAPTGMKPSSVATVSQRAEFQIAQGKNTEARQTLAIGRGWTSDHPNFAWLSARAALALGDLVAAERELRLLFTLAERSYTEPILEGAATYLGLTALGLVLLQTARAPAAVSAFEAALQTRSDHEPARLGRAEALIDAGRAAEALVAVEGLLAADSVDGWTLAAAAALALGDGEAAITFASRASHSTRWVDERRRDRQALLHAELSFRAGTPRAGAGPWGTIGALVCRTPLRDPAPVPAEIAAAAALSLVEQGRADDLGALFERRAEAMAPGIGATVREALRAVGLDWTDETDPDFVFVGGAGRSGTTLFRAMLSAHPNLWCGPERKLVPVLGQLHAQWEQTLGKDLAEAGVDRDGLDAAARGWLTAFLGTGAPAGRRIAEKTPHNLVYTAWLGRLYPRARFIHVLRDGRAVAESLVRQRWVDPATGQLLPMCRDLEGAARYWATVVSQIRSQAGSVPGRFLEVRYEDLVAEPEATMERVLAFLGEPWDEAVLHHEDADVALSARESSTAAVRQARTTDAVTKWHGRLSEPDLNLIRRAAGPVLDATGYSTG